MKYTFKQLLKFTNKQLIALLKFNTLELRPSLFCYEVLERYKLNIDFKTRIVVLRINESEHIMYHWPQKYNQHIEQY